MSDVSAAAGSLRRTLSRRRTGALSKGSPWTPPPPSHSAVQNPGVVVGLDNGGTSNNATVLDHTGRFLVDHMLESRSRVQEGPVLAMGLDTPGPASAAGVIST